jgi:hypothetical protein
MARIEEPADCESVCDRHQRAPLGLPHNEAKVSQQGVNAFGAETVDDE